MDMDNSAAIAVERGWVEVEEATGGINGDGKKPTLLLLNSQSDVPKSLPYLKSGSDVCSLASGCVFSLVMGLLIFVGSQT